MREAPLYCRPKNVLFQWRAHQIEGDIFFFGVTRRGEPVSSAQIEFFDSELQIGIDMHGETWLVAVELVGSRAAYKDMTDEILSLISGRREKRCIPPFSHAEQKLYKKLISRNGK
jgi:hypothetical protein